MTSFLCNHEGQGMSSVSKANALTLGIFKEESPAEKALQRIPDKSGSP